MQEITGSPGITKCEKCGAYVWGKPDGTEMVVADFAENGYIRYGAIVMCRNCGNRACLKNAELRKPWLMELEELCTQPLFRTQRDRRRWEDDPTLREIGSVVVGIQIIERNALEAYARGETEVNVPTLSGSIRLPHPRPAANRLSFRESFMDAYYELHKRIRAVESFYFDLPVVYVWNAYFWAWLGSYDSAYISISAGLMRCADKAELCYEMGKLQSEQNRISALGWRMQACMLAYDTPHPYLDLAIAAAETGLTDLELRLLNLCDAYWVMLRLPTDAEAQIRELVRKDIERAKESLKNFGRYMTPFLPAANLLPSPRNNLERSTDIQLQEFFADSSPLIREKVRLQSIMKRGSGFIPDTEAEDQKQK